MQDSNQTDDDARFRVALIVETSNEYARGLLRGIAHYSNDHGPWSLSLSEHGPWLSNFHGKGKDTVVPDWLERWEGDGIIARIESPALARLIDRLASRPLDEGTEHFGPSTLVPLTFDTGNPAANVIPGACRATVNIRFNDAHHSNALTRWLREEAASVTDETEVGFEMDIQVSG
ncbi:MAG: peptidase dimerization domain-containing protein, partial [Planctomycetota bacterium]